MLQNNMWVILHNTKEDIFSFITKESLDRNKKWHKNDVIIQELSEGLSYDDARKQYIEFLDKKFPVISK
jgi:hypothetical protein